VSHRNKRKKRKKRKSSLRRPRLQNNQLKAKKLRKLLKSRSRSQPRKRRHPPRLTSANWILELVR